MDSHFLPRDDKLAELIHSHLDLPFAQVAQGDDVEFHPIQEVVERLDVGSHLFQAFHVPVIPVPDEEGHLHGRLVLLRRGGHVDGRGGRVALHHLVGRFVPDSAVELEGRILAHGLGFPPQRWIVLPRQILPIANPLEADGLRSACSAFQVDGGP